MVPLYGPPTDSSCSGQRRCWWDQRHQGSHLVRRQHQRDVGRVRRMCRESKQSQLGWRCAGSPSSSGWGGESCCRSSTIAAAAVESMSILVHPTPCALVAVLRLEQMEEGSFNLRRPRDGCKEKARVLLVCCDDGGVGCHMVDALGVQKGESLLRGRSRSRGWETLVIHHQGLCLWLVFLSQHHHCLASFAKLISLPSDFGQGAFLRLLQCQPIGNQGQLCLKRCFRCRR